MGLKEFLGVYPEFLRSGRLENFEGIEVCARVDELMDKLIFPAAESPVVVLLRVNSRCLFMEAVNIALTGHRMSLICILRAALESACYAYQIRVNPDDAAAWVDRSRDEESRKKCRKVFGPSVKVVSKHFDNVYPDHKGLIEDSYNSLIDYGAHPSHLAISMSVDVEESEDSYNVNFNILGGAGVEWGVFSCFQIGLICAWLMIDFDSQREELKSTMDELISMVRSWRDSLNEKTGSGS